MTILTRKQRNTIITAFAIVVVASGSIQIDKEQLLNDTYRMHDLTCAASPDKMIMSETMRAELGALFDKAQSHPRRVIGTQVAISLCKSVVVFAGVVAVVTGGIYAVGKFNQA